MIKLARNRREGEVHTNKKHKSSFHYSLRMKHKFYFGTTDVVLAKDASTKDDHWYDVRDPRNAMNKRRREDSARSSKRHHK